MPVKQLSDVFNKTTTSYKFYWLLALLDNTDSTTLRISSMLTTMIAKSWYHVCYLGLSLGKQDQLHGVIQTTKNHSLLIDASTESEVISALQQSVTLLTFAHSLGRFVPYRFLSPWFSVELQGQPDHKKNDIIRICAERDFAAASAPLYKFTSNCQEIIMHPLWLEYFQQHHSTIQRFCHLHLLNFLQKRNPNASISHQNLFLQGNHTGVS